jgi:hypothetical protein
MSLTSPRKWPYLASLCGGYLHQDFTAVHGNAAGAVQAWLADASPEEARDLSSEWRTFLNVTRGMDPQTRARALRELAGGSWAPADSVEFDVVSALLMNGART